MCGASRMPAPRPASSAPCRAVRTWPPSSSASSATRAPTGTERAVAVAGPGWSMCTCEARVPYEPGYLALREGAALERAVRGLGAFPDVLLVDATGPDHQRGAGPAVHL